MEKFINAGENAVYLLGRNWKLRVLFGLIAFFTPEIVMTANRFLDLKTLNFVVSYLDPIYRILGLGFLGYASYLKTSAPKANK